MSNDLSEWFTDGTPDDLEARARRMSIVTALSHEQAVSAIRRFTAAMQSVVRAYEGSAGEIDRLRVELDAPRRSAMHAAYHHKTRRRNRR